MPKADTNSTASDRAEPHGWNEASAAAIGRLRVIAAHAADRLLLGDGPVHPDAALLELCGEALHHLRHAESVYASRPPRSPDRPWTAEEHAIDRRLMDEYYQRLGHAQKHLRRAKKLRASTAAGVYAKALCVRASRTGAAELARSLANDFLALPALRESLWPAELRDRAGTHGPDAASALRAA